MSSNRRYSIKELSDPKTYINNPTLIAITKKCTHERHTLPIDKISKKEFSQDLLLGKYPKIVLKYLTAYINKKTLLNELLLFTKTITLPKNYSLEIEETENKQFVLIRGPYCDKLLKRVKKIKGFWDGLGYKNRKLIIIPLNNIKKLPLIIKNWQKEIDQIKNENIDNAIIEKELKLLTVTEQWIGYIQNKAKDGYLYTKGITTLQKLDLSDHPEIKQNINKLIQDAIKTCNKVKEKKFNTKTYGNSWVAKKMDMCCKCKNSIHIGDIIHKAYLKNSNYLEHVDCIKAKKARIKIEGTSKKYYYLSGSYTENPITYNIGTIIKTDKTIDDRKTWPTYLYVVHIIKNVHYMNEENFKIYYRIKCRAATKDEAKSFKYSMP